MDLQFACAATPNALSAAAGPAGVLPRGKLARLGFLFILAVGLLIGLRYRAVRVEIPSGGARVAVTDVLSVDPKVKWGQVSFQLGQFYVRGPLGGVEEAGLAVGDRLTVVGWADENRQLEAESIRRIGEVAWVKTAQRVRRRLQLIIQQALPEPHASLLAGMVLGIKRSLPPDLEVNLIRTGLLHIVVVSGFNVSLVATSLRALLGFFGRRVGLFLALLGITLFTLLTGAEPPVVRAAIMGSVLLLGHYWGRPRDTLYLLLLTVGLMLLINPLYLESLSFQLSALATLGIITIEPIFRRRFPGEWFGLAEGFWGSLSAQIMVWPLIAYHFGRISLLSPLVNALVLWSVPAATSGGSLALLLSLVLPKLGYPVFYVSYLLLNYLVVIVNRWGGWGVGFGELTLPSWGVAGYYLSLSGLGWIWYRRRRRG